MITHYKKFYSNIFGNPGTVPIVIVVTGLEDSRDLGKWWRDNSPKYRTHDLGFHDGAGITALPDSDNPSLQRNRAYSRGAVHALISQHCLPLV